MNYKAELDELAKIILWIVFFILAGAGIYYMVKTIFK